MDKDKDLEYHLDESGDLPSISEKWSIKTKILFIFLILFIIILIVAIILLLLFYRKNNTNNNEKQIYEYEFKSFINISYAKNDIIVNSFKKGGENYNETLGNINDGLDYRKSDRNIYDLFIPYSDEKRKKKYNKIILNIHGGCWVGGDKEGYQEQCQTKAKEGFICSGMDYTLLNYYNNSNIFRIIDEITAVLQNIKEILIKEGFDGNKLEIYLTGGSAGAHLSMLYGYWIKNSPIPIKFIVNQIGPVTLEPDHFIKPINIDEPLNSIEPADIEEAQKNGKIEIIKRDKYNISPTFLVMIMNIFLGGKLTDDLGDIIIDFDAMEINVESENYKKMFNKVQIAFPVNHIDENTIPTLCFYGGKDIDVGIGQYSYLKRAFEEKNNNNIVLVYSKYSSHEEFDTKSEEGKVSIQKYYDQLSYFENTYFTKD